jgi:type IV secretory pathway VirB10-like protein
MTYQDPKLPNVEPGRNPPVYCKPTDGSSGPGTIVAMVVGAVLIVGLALYAFSGPKRTAVTTPPTTTGQSTIPSTQPVPPRMAPVAPAAPSTTLPPVDQNVPAEKVAPPLPTEPRNNP